MRKAWTVPPPLVAPWNHLHQIKSCLYTAYCLFYSAITGMRFSRIPRALSRPPSSAPQQLPSMDSALFYLSVSSWIELYGRLKLTDKITRPSPRGFLLKPFSSIECLVRESLISLGTRLVWVSLLSTSYFPLYHCPTPQWIACLHLCYCRCCGCHYGHWWVLINTQFITNLLSPP